MSSRFFFNDGHILKGKKAKENSNLERALCAYKDWHACLYALAYARVYKYRTRVS